LENLLKMIKGCVVKDHRHQKMLYAHFFGYALQIVFRYIYRYEKAVDVTNDGFVKLFASFERFVAGSTEDNEKILMGYIKRIMINSAIDQLRKDKMAPEIGGIPEYVWDMSSKEQEADQLLLYKELIIMTKKLPPQYRIIFNMYVVDGYNHLEIADLLGISTGTSKSGLSRARALLQKEIKKNESKVTCSM
jgi:RNA polymerase sigma factor (sigma-70 family)